MKELPKFNMDKEIAKINEENTGDILQKKPIDIDIRNKFEESGEYMSRFLVSLYIKTCVEKNEEYTIVKLQEVISKYPQLTEVIRVEIKDLIVVEKNKLKTETRKVGKQIISNKIEALERLKELFSELYPE